MADSACGYNRQPVNPAWTTEQKACEAALWKIFKDSCLVCSGDELCLAQKYTDYINGRAQCLTGTKPECG